MTGEAVRRSNVFFWFLAILLAMFLFAASAPSPLYGIYARLFRFSPTTVTAIYAVYAAGALGALLMTGRLSDHFGRKPVVIVALVIQIAGMAAFIRADGVGALYLGRILQGVGTGIASGAISAWLVDLEPPERPRLGSLLVGVALLAGLGSGALCAGLLVQYGPHPLRFVFWLLIGIYGIASVIVLAGPDVIERRPGWASSMRPQIGVPPVARPQFAASGPTLVAIWALAGLYLSLGPTLALTLAGSDNRAVGGSVIFALAGSGAIASASVRTVDPRALLTKGSLVVVVGVGITLLGVIGESVAGLFAGSVVAGLGLGAGFSGVVRSLGPLVPPQERGALFAAVYIAVYMSFSVPTVIAGLATTRYGLRDTTYAYGTIVMILAMVTYVAVSRRDRAGPIA